MGLINDLKRKYNIEEKENVPQFVYGPPDLMKKKKEKYDMDPEQNYPQIVYGIPDFMKEKYLEEKNKYDISPEDNMPREVYGIPDALRNAEKYDIDPRANIPQKVYGVRKPDDIRPFEPSIKTIGISIQKDGKNYALMFSSGIDGKVDLLFGDINDIDDKTIFDITIEIPRPELDRFIDRYKELTRDWRPVYEGNRPFTWNIIDKMVFNRTITGAGEVPHNWNQFMDLLIEFEMLYKRHQEHKKDKTFEEMVRGRIKDIFFADMIIRYFKDELEESDFVAKACFEDICKYDDILNEFSKFLTQRNYNIPNPVVVCGYTAKSLSELNPNLTASGVYTFLQFLRDDEEEALKVIKHGFPNKDAHPPIIPALMAKTKDDVNEDRARRCLKEIEEEVDQELIRRGLMHIDNGKKIPAFGSCHTRWAIEKQILKERYNIDWQTPAEKNPFTKFD